MIPGSSNAKRLTNLGTTSFVAYFSQPLVIAVSDGITALLSWLIYECSDIVEQRMIPGGRLTDVNTCNCYMYICRNGVGCREEVEINQGTSAATQLTREDDQRTHNLIRAFIGQLSSLLLLTVSLHSYHGYSMSAATLLSRGYFLEAG